MAILNPNWNLLKTIRERNLRQYQVAALIGLDGARFSKIVNRIERPSKEIRSKIAKVLSVEENKIFHPVFDVRASE